MCIKHDDTYFIVSFFIGIISRAELKCLYKDDKLSSKVMTISSFLTSTSKHASWYAIALTLWMWSNKLTPLCILHVQKLQRMKKILNKFVCLMDVAKGLLCLQWLYKPQSTPLKLTKPITPQCTQIISTYIQMNFWTFNPLKLEPFLSNELLNIQLFQPYFPKGSPFMKAHVTHEWVHLWRYMLVYLLKQSSHAT